MVNKKSCCIPQHQERSVAYQNGEHKSASVEFDANVSVFESSILSRSPAVLDMLVQTNRSFRLMKNPPIGG